MSEYIYEKQFDRYFAERCGGCDITLQKALDAGISGWRLDRTLFTDSDGKYMVFCDTCMFDDGGWHCADCFNVYTEYKKMFFANQPDKKLAKQLWDLYGSKDTVELSNCSNAWCKNCADDCEDEA